MLDNYAFAVGDHRTDLAKLFRRGLQELGHACVQVFIVGKDVFLDDLI